MKTSNTLGATIILLITILTSATALAQKSGQSVQIQFGVVVAANYVQEKSDAGKAAVVGGAIGYGLTRDRSSSTKAASTVAGAAIAGSRKSKSEGDREAREYQVRTATGMVVLISDQTEVLVDDCVSVENAGSNNAKIRRVDPGNCAALVQEAPAESQG